MENGTITNTHYVSSLLALTDTNFAAGDETGVIKIWDITKSEPIRELTGHFRQVWCLIKVEEIIIVSGSRDKNIKIWNWK